MASKQLTVDKNNFYWRGGIGVLLGVFVLIWPGLTTLTLVTFLTIWLLLSGVSRLVDSVVSATKNDVSRLASMVVGVFELGVGAYLVQRPSVTALTIVSLIGAVFVVQGVVHLMRSMASSAAGKQLMLSQVFAVLSVVAGIWLWRYPMHGALAFVWLIGLYAIVSGALLVALGTEVE